MAASVVIRLGRGSSPVWPASKPTATKTNVTVARRGCTITPLPPSSGIVALGLGRPPAGSGETPPPLSCSRDSAGTAQGKVGSAEVLAATAGQTAPMRKGVEAGASAAGRAHCSTSRWVRHWCYRQKTAGGRVVYSLSYYHACRSRCAIEPPPLHNRYGEQEG